VEGDPDQRVPVHECLDGPAQVELTEAERIVEVEREVELRDLRLLEVPPAVTVDAGQPTRRDGPDDAAGAVPQCLVTFAVSRAGKPAQHPRRVRRPGRGRS